MLSNTTNDNFLKKCTSNWCIYTKFDIYFIKNYYFNDVIADTEVWFGQVSSEIDNKNAYYLCSKKYMLLLLYPTNGIFFNIVHRTGVLRHNMVFIFQKNAIIMLI